MSKPVENEENIQNNSVDNKESVQPDEMLNEEVSGKEYSAEKSATGEQEELKDQKDNRPEETDWQDKYLRLYSEFENFRRRTQKERFELIQSAGKDMLVALLPIVDDFDRALKQMEQVSEDQKPLIEGVNLIQKKLWALLESRGVKAIDSIGQPFDTDFHEAITKIPAPSEELKGKVVDEVEKGYLLNEKVIRFSKVVIGE